MAACRCPVPARREIRTTQLVRIEFARSDQVLVYPITEFCTNCRGVLAPAEYSWARVSESDSDAEMAIYRGIRAGARYFGTANDAQTAGFVLWSEIASCFHIPTVRRSEMFTQFAALKEEELRGRLRRYLGLSTLVDEVAISTPIGDIRITYSIVDHLFAINPETGKNRIDADHVQMWPLVVATLRTPIEIWEANATPTRPHCYRFLAMYHIGERILIHLVVVDRQNLTAITSYRLDPETDPMKRVEKERGQISRYLRWLENE